MKIKFLTLHKVIKSEHPPELLINRLTQIIDSNSPKSANILLQFGIVKTPEKDYYGTIEGNHFSLKETVSYNKGGKVSIIGNIREINGGSIIEMEVRASLFIRAFLFYFLCCIVIVQIVFLISKPFNPELLAPTGMMIFAYAGFNGMHWMMFSGIFDEFEELFTKPLVVHGKRRRR